MWCLFGCTIRRNFRCKVFDVWYIENSMYVTFSDRGLWPKKLADTVSYRIAEREKGRETRRMAFVSDGPKLLGYFSIHLNQLMLSADAQSANWLSVKWRDTGPRLLRRPEKPINLVFVSTASQCWRRRLFFSLLSVVNDGIILWGALTKALSSKPLLIRPYEKKSFKKS